MENLKQRDRQFLWHPLTQHGLNPDILPIASAKGVWLYDDAGNRYIDAISSWYCSVYGHSHPRIVQAVQAQLEQLDHVVFSGFTHEPAVRLTEALLSILPQNQSRVFYSDNGSTATEVGIKMALQYFFNQGKSRPVILALDNGFHGDTFGAMSVSGLSVYNGPFEKHFIEVERVPVPAPETIDAILQTLERRLQKRDIAGFIYEPLVQGAAAMQTHKAEDLNRILELLRQYGVLLIADEVMTGFGKTGTHFASDQIHTSPDILCMSKALTAGITPMGATSCTKQIFEGFLSEDLAKGFFHGHTYTANPLACTAARTAIELLISDPIQLSIHRIIESHKRFDQRVKLHPKVEQTRQSGVIYALDLKAEIPRYGKERDLLYRSFLKEEVFLRPLGNTIYIVPPFTIETPELSQVYNAIVTVLDQI